MLGRIFTWGTTIILTSLLCGGLLVVVIHYEHYYPSREFNEAAWRVSNETRYEMSEDLIERGMLIGKTKDDVQTVLGPDFHQYKEDQWAYYTGTRPGFRFGQDAIYIYFKNGKVERVEQHNSWR